MNNCKEKVYICVDVSGSMDDTKRNEAIKIMDKYIKDQNNDVELIKYTTVASEISYEDYKNKRSESGGTYTSSALRLAFDKIINLKMGFTQEYSKIKVVILSDGDNWQEDDVRVKFVIEQLKNMNVDIKFYNILPSSYCTQISDRLIKNGIISRDDVEVIKKITKDLKSEEKEQNVILSIKQEDNKTIVNIVEGLNLSVGTAECLKKNEFDKNIGISLAFIRALGLSKIDMLKIFSDNEILNELNNRFKK